VQAQNFRFASYVTLLLDMKLRLYRMTSRCTPVDKDSSDSFVNQDCSVEHIIFQISCV